MRYIGQSRGKWAENEALLLPAAAGLLSFLSFPQASLGGGILAWIALAPLVTAAARSSTTLGAARAGVVYGLFCYFPLLVWIPPVLVRYGDIPGWLAWLLYTLMIAVFALFPGVVAALSNLSIRRLGPGGLFGFPFFWVAMELGRNYIPFGGFPWLQLGYSQTDRLAVIQIADLAGVYGVSFLVAWVNAAAACVVLRRADRTALVAAGVGATLVLGALGYGSSRLARWDQIVPDRTAALLQGNLAFDEPEDQLAWKFGRGYQELAGALGDGPIDLGVIPESPAPTLYQEDAPYREAMRALAARFRFGLIFNNTRVEGSGSEARYYNSAFLLSERGVDAGRYDKVHLVPFGEYVPLRRLFFFAESITKDVSAFTPGETLAPVALGGHAIGLSICFESIFPNLVRRSIRQGGELLVNLTNDGWYGETAAPHQHLAMARWRAVENRRFLLRAANSGISAVITPTGQLAARTSLFTREVCVGRLAFLSGASPYASWGDLFAGLCAIISLLVGALALAGGRAGRGGEVEPGG